jgi:hypothetical protein
VFKTAKSNKKILHRSTNFDRLYIVLYLLKGGKLMSYQKLLEQVARGHNTTPQEVDSEMRTALQTAGYDIELAMFIALATAKAKKTIHRN